MNEEIFREILARVEECEFAEYDNAPEHKFSLKHRIAMKRIFARYERSVRKIQKKEPVKPQQADEYKSKLSMKQRLLLVTIVIILMTFLVGWVVVFVSDRFHGTVYRDNTQLTAANLENCPQKIESKYALANIPEGFEMIETNSSIMHVYTLYMNQSTNQTIALRQWVKSKFKPHYNTEHYVIEEVNANGLTGLCVDFSDVENSRTLVVWDNDDYILEILADLDKDSVINLSSFDKCGLE